MILNKTNPSKLKMNHSILAFSHQAVSAYRFFSKEDFLFMMSDMTLEDINSDLERFKELEEYEICEKIAFVINEIKQVNRFLKTDLQFIL